MEFVSFNAAIGFRAEAHEGQQKEPKQRFNLFMDWSKNF